MFAWLTTANRVINYLSTDDLSVNLVTLATFILELLTPMWFTIKTKLSCRQGAFNIWKTFYLFRYLPKPLEGCTTSDFLHPENMLLG